MQPAGNQRSASQDAGLNDHDNGREAALALNRQPTGAGPKQDISDSPEQDFGSYFSEPQISSPSQPATGVQSETSSHGVGAYVATPPPAQASNAPVHQPAPAPPVPAADIAVPAETRATGTVEELRLQVGDSPGQRVEVVMSQKNGSLHVTTRTPNSELAQNLRENLPDLVTNLQNRGLQADLWTGSRPAAQSGEGERTAAASPNFSDKNDANESGTMARNYDQPDQSGRRPKQPTWEDLDD